ncbi:glucosidase II beta subunit-like protein-domain-containing protein [Fusarium acuminatum]|uniref:Glucosidase 2 subunit beta n=1 Tax=Fusarium acuminatum TaxID=5515 RepID=A0ABZ2X953_9HYPO
MQHPNSVALLSAIYAFTLAAAGSVPRGVGPEFVSHYEGKEEFSCITNAAIKLSLDQINDNTCDCPDGSDEPGTAACANIDPLSPEQPLAGSLSGTTNTTNALPGFWCANEGHIGMYVPFLYVNDGVCDYDLCCDGSEEYSTVHGVKCENKCAEIGKEHRRLEDEKRKNMQQAAKKRGAMVAEAKDLRQKVEQKVADLNKEIATLEAKKEELARKHREAEQQDKGKVVREGGNGGESTLVRAAREALDAANRDLSDKQSTLNVEQADLTTDYGPDDIFRALKGKCVSLEAGEYTYEQCWLDRTKQKSKKGHGQSNMGNFKRIDREMADDEERIDGKSLGKGERMVLRYEDGQQCWNGPQRRTDVWLGCAETEELWRVSESEKCVYKMEIGTPAACDFSKWDVGTQPKKPRSRDEL